MSNKISEEIVKDASKIAQFENRHHLLFIFILLIPISLNLYLLNYVFKLEGTCDCSKDWRRDYIKYFLLLSLFFSLATVITIDFLKTIKSEIVSIILSAIWVVYLYVVFTYIRKLKNSKCLCSEDTARTVMQIVNYIGIGSIVLSILSPIIMIGYLMYSLKNNK